MIDDNELWYVKTHTGVYQYTAQHLRFIVETNSLFIYYEVKQQNYDQWEPIHQVPQLIPGTLFDLRYDWSEVEA